MLHWHKKLWRIFMKKNLVHILLLSVILNCESREDRKSKNEDKVLKDLISAGTLSLAARDLLKVPCSETVSEANTDTTVTVPSSGNFKICGKEKLTGASVKFSSSKKYRITASNGTQVLESSRCNSRSFSIDVTFSSSFGTQIVNAVDSSSSAEHTSDSGIVYKITSNGPVDANKYSCGGAGVSSRIPEAFSVYFEQL